MICLKVKYTKGADKVAYFPNKKACCIWLNLQQNLKSASVHFENRRGEDVVLHGKYDIDSWVEKNVK